MPDNTVTFTKSIRFRTVAWLVILSVTPLAFVAFGSLFVLKNTSSDLLINASIQAALQVGVKFDAFVDKYEEIFDIVVADRRPLLGDSKKSLEIMKGMEIYFDAIEKVVIYETGRGIIRSTAQETDIESREKSPSSAYSGDKLYDSKIDDFIPMNQERHFDDSFLYLRRAISTNQDIISVISLHKLSKQIERISLGTSLRIFVLDEDGDDVLESHDFPAQFIASLVNKPYGAYDIVDALTGKRNQVAVVLPVLRYGLKVIVLQDAAEVYGLVDSIEKRMGYFVFFILAITLIAGICLARKFVQPVLILSKKASDISRGDLKARVTSFGDDELGMLSKNFNSMAVQIERRIFELASMFRISRIISTTEGYQRILDEITGEIMGLFHAERGSILLMAGKKGKEYLQLSCFRHYDSQTAKYTEEDDDRKKELSIADTIRSFVIEKGQALLYQEGLNPLDNQFPTIDSVQGKPKTLMVAPLIIKGSPIGMIMLGEKMGQESFNQDELSLLQTISSQLAVSIENARLYELAITDGMTQLYIHRFFQVKLEEEVKRTKRYKDPLCLIMMDIDHFKKLNDNYGHQQGDVVLIETAKIMKESMRETDFPCRYGGEEFSLILPTTDIEGALVVAERLRKRIEEFQFISEKGPIKVTISLGISQCPDHAPDKDALIKAADTALYHSKKSGRNKTTIYEKGMKINNEKE